MSSEYCVILAGGIGSHFWPISREDKPKQFQIAQHSGCSFLQQTYSRMKTIFPESHIYISSNIRYRGLIFEQLPDVPEDHLILEPLRRNTAPAIAFSAYTILKKDPNAVMVITPSDHEISDIGLFGDTIRKAMRYAGSTNALVTLGIIPTSPNPNFGYVQVSGGKNSYVSGVPVKAKTFTEKPTRELAQVFLDSGEFLWNSGIFIWKASAIREEMHKCCPEITRLWKGWQKELGGIHENRFIEHAYADSPNISIDYAVLEKSDDLCVLPASFGWSDVGTYNSLYEYDSENKDENGNLVQSNGKIILKDISGSIIYNKNPRKLLALRGLEDYVVIDTDDVLLICPRKDAVFKEMIIEMKRPEFEEFR